MKDFTTVLLVSLFVVFVLISLLSVSRRPQSAGLTTSHGKIADSETGLEAILLHQLTLSRSHLSDGKEKKC
jgi:hypothetical protein